jgi:hypothetical protein
MRTAVTRESRKPPGRGALWRIDRPRRPDSPVYEIDQDPNRFDLTRLQILAVQPDGTGRPSNNNRQQPVQEPNECARPRDR